MKVLVVGLGFVGLTTACVLASRGVEVYLEESNVEKLSCILDGKPSFYEDGLESLLKSGLKSGNILANDWSVAPDLTLITVGTPSRKDGSMDIAFVEEALINCSKNLMPDSLVAIKSTVLPGTTRSFQNLPQLSNLELMMIPEFLREGSAVYDALNPDRIVIGSSNHEFALRAAAAMGYSADDALFTSTYSAECIKYISNAFLATCISFTNEIFSNINQDTDFEVNKILKGWHSDKRFLPNDQGFANLTNYLVPGPGFGGSCFPKDVRALKQQITTNNNNPRIINATIEVNTETLIQTAQWVESQLEGNRSFVILGMGFKDFTDDTRESPSVFLAKWLSDRGFEGAWYDDYVQHLDESIEMKLANHELLANAEIFILMHHNERYRDLIAKHSSLPGDNSKVTVLALRNQKPIKGVSWVYPRMRKV